MFKNKFEMGRLMSPENEGSAGGSSDNGGQGGADQQQKPAAKSVEEITAELTAKYEARIAAMEEKNKEILAEKRALKETVEVEKKKKAEQDKDYVTLYKLESEANIKLKAELDEIKNEKLSEKQKVLKTQMYNAFLKEIGSELHDPELAFSLIDQTKMIVDEKGKYGFNEKGMKSLSDEFRSKHSYLIKSDALKLPGAAAKSTADDISKMSFGERLQKAREESKK